MENSQGLPHCAYNHSYWQNYKSEQWLRSRSELPQKRISREAGEPLKFGLSVQMETLNLESSERIPRRMKPYHMQVMNSCDQSRFMSNPSPINGISIDFYNPPVIYPVNSFCGHPNPINFTFLNLQPPFQQIRPVGQGFSHPVYLSDNQAQPLLVSPSNTADSFGAGNRIGNTVRTQDELSSFNRIIDTNSPYNDNNFYTNKNAFQNPMLSEQTSQFSRGYEVTVSQISKPRLFFCIPVANSSQAQQAQQLPFFQKFTTCPPLPNPVPIDPGLKNQDDELRLSKDISIEQSFAVSNERASNFSKKEDFQVADAENGKQTLNSSKTTIRNPRKIRLVESLPTAQSIPPSQHSDFRDNKLSGKSLEDQSGPATGRPQENKKEIQTPTLKGSILDPLRVESIHVEPQQTDKVKESSPREIRPLEGKLEVLPVYVSITKKNRLLCLFNLLKSLFLNELNVLATVTDITEKEFLIFQRIILKKTGDLLDKKERLLDPAVASRILEKFNRNSVKRKEENCKFVYKSVLKRMMRAFELRNGIKQDENTIFYNHYFREIANEMHQPVERYWDPTSMRIPNRSSFKTPFKSINHNFLLQVFAAKQFKKEFCAFLSSSEFLEMCREKINKKLAKLMNKWDKELRSTSIERFQEKVENYFREAKRCKLPWTIYEVEVARKYFLELPYFD